MKEKAANKPVERLFPFAIRSRCVIVGRDTLARSRNKLSFILATRDLSENSLQRMLFEFRNCPVVQRYQSEDIEKFFGFKGTKVVGFLKSPLSRSIYAELKEHRLKNSAADSDDRRREPSSRRQNPGTVSATRPSPDDSASTR